MPDKIGSDFMLRPFTNDDYSGLVILKNTLFPDHPTTIENMRHHDKTHYKKIKQNRWVFEQDENIVVSAMYTQFFEAYHPKKFVIIINLRHYPKSKICEAI